MARFGN